MPRRTSRYRQFDLTGAEQIATSFLLKAPNEVTKAYNSRFDTDIGAITRRKGYELFGSQVQSGKTGLGAHVSKFDSGEKLIVNFNNSGDTGTVFTYVQSGSNTTLTLPGSVTVQENTKVQYVDSLGETYAAGYSDSASERMDLLNIQSDNTMSDSRNLYGAPDKAKFIAEYGGALYAMNVKVGSNTYPDRIYRSSAPTGVITFIKGDQSGTLTELSVDSTRYLKTGMTIDIYTKGTSTKVVDSLAITSVDKAENKIGFSSTSVTVGDNDELWIEDRYNELAHLWNTDDPTEEDADYIRIEPGASSDRAVTGWGKSNNRLFIFTKNSMQKWDGNNFVTVSTNVGCISHETIKEIDGWLVWLDAEGHIRARKDSTGEFFIISRAIEKRYIDDITESQLEDASAVSVGEIYKIAIGQIDNDYIPNKYVRFVYDFGANTWSTETHQKPMPVQFAYSVSGILKPYFLDNDGKVFEDEKGNQDNGTSIPWTIELGDDLFGTEQLKQLHQVFVFSKKAIGTVVSVKYDGSDWVTIGKIENDVERISLGKELRNRDFTYRNIRFTNNGNADPQQLLGIVSYYSTEESNASERH